MTLLHPHCGVEPPDDHHDLPRPVASSNEVSRQTTPHPAEERLAVTLWLAPLGPLPQWLSASRQKYEDATHYRDRRQARDSSRDHRNRVIGKMARQILLEKIPDSNLTVFGPSQAGLMRDLGAILAQQLNTPLTPMMSLGEPSAFDWTALRLKLRQRCAASQTPLEFVIVACPAVMTQLSLAVRRETDPSLRYVQFPQAGYLTLAEVTL